MAGFRSNPVVKILAWPEELVPTTMSLQNVTSTTVFTSPFGRYTQSQELPGARWKLEATFENLDEAQANILRAFKAKLRGSAGMFYFKAEQSVVPIAPQVLVDDKMAYSGSTGQPRTQGYQVDNGALAGAGALATKGWTEPAGTLVIAAGEHISFDDYFGYRSLHLVVNNAEVTESGQCTLVLEPPVRFQAPPDSDIMTVCPSGMFRLMDDAQLMLTERPGKLFSATLSATEASNPSVNFGLEPYPPRDYNAKGAVLDITDVYLGDVLPGATVNGQLTVTNTGIVPVTGMRFRALQSGAVITASTCGDSLVNGESCTVNYDVTAPAGSGRFEKNVVVLARNADVTPGFLAAHVGGGGGPAGNGRTDVAPRYLLNFSAMHRHNDDDTKWQKYGMFNGNLSAGGTHITTTLFKAESPVTALNEETYIHLYLTNSTDETAVIEDIDIFNSQVDMSGISVTFCERIIQSKPAQYLRPAGGISPITDFDIYDEWAHGVQEPPYDIHEYGRFLYKINDPVMPTFVAKNHVVEHPLTPEDILENERRAQSGGTLIPYDWRYFRWFGYGPYEVSTALRAWEEELRRDFSPSSPISIRPQSHMFLTIKIKFTSPRPLSTTSVRLWGTNAGIFQLDIVARTYE